MQENYKKEIDRWVKNVTENEKQTIWKIADTLKRFSELAENHIIKVPYETLKQAGIDEDKASAIFTVFLEKGIVRVIKFDEEDLYMFPPRGISTDTDGFRYLYSVLKKQFSDSDAVKTTTRQEFNLTVSPDGRSGTLEAPDGTPIVLRGSYFGAVRVFIESKENIVSQNNLQEAISKYLQGTKKEPGEIIIAKWKGEFKKSNPRFFRYFDIEPIAKNVHQLVEKSS